MNSTTSLPYFSAPIWTTSPEPSIYQTSLSATHNYPQPNFGIIGRPLDGNYGIDTTTTSTVATALQASNESRRPALPQSLPMTPDEYDEHIRATCENISYFLSRDLLSNTMQMMWLSLCPIRTPVQREPHHVDQAKEYQANVMKKLQAIVNVLQDLEAKSITNAAATATPPTLTGLSSAVDGILLTDPTRMPAMPDLRLLDEYCKEYRNDPEVEPKIAYIIRLVQDTYYSCANFWQERDQMHRKITQDFERLISAIQGHIMTLHHRMWPELTEMLQNRLHIEQKLHERQTIIVEQQRQSREIFYNKVHRFTQEQKLMLQDMMHIIHHELQQRNPRATATATGINNTAAGDMTSSDGLNYAREMKHARDLDKGLNLWITIVEQHAQMRTPYPLLPSMLHELQCWLNKFQTFMNRMVDAWAPRLPATIRPEAPVQVTVPYNGEFERPELRPQPPQQQPLQTSQPPPPAPPQRLFQGMGGERFLGAPSSAIKDNHRSYNKKDDDNDDDGGDHNRENDDDNDNNDNNDNNVNVPMANDEYKLFENDGDDDDADNKTRHQPKNSIRGRNETMELMQDKLQKLYQHSAQTMQALDEMKAQERVSFQRQFPGLKFPTTSSSSSNNTRKANSPMVSGLMNLNPRVFEYYTQLQLQSVQDLHRKQAEKQQLLDRHKLLEHEIAALSTEAEKRISEPALADIFQQYSDSTRSAGEAYQVRAVAESFHSEQYRLRTRLQWLESQRHIAKEQFENLRPRIEQQEGLVQALNRLILTLNEFSAQHSKKWMDFIQEERALCHGWKQAQRDYNLTVLNFREDTRRLLELQIESDYHELCRLLDECFNRLISSHLQHLFSVRQLGKKSQQRVGELRGLLNIEHTDLVRMRLDKVTREISVVTKFLDSTIYYKELQQWSEYSTMTQKSFAVFAKSIQVMVETLFEHAQLDKYLHLLNQVCCNDKFVGCVPCPRLCKTPLIPSCDQTWIQLTEYPREVEAINLITGPAAAREAAIDFAVARQGFSHEPKEIAENQQNLVQLIQDYRRHLYQQ